MDKKKYSKRGNPFKRGKTWTYVVYVTNPLTGKKTPKYKGGFPTKKEAEAALKEAEAKVLLCQYVQDKKTTVEQHIKHWFYQIHIHTIKPNTANGYINIIENHIIPAIGRITLDKLHRIDIQNFYNSLLADKGLSITTLYYVHRVLRKALKEAVLNDLMLKNPCDSVKLPKKKRYKATILDTEQIKVLLNAILGSDCELEVLIAITMGLRRGEVLGLRLQDFNFEKKTVQVCQQITMVHDTAYLKKHPEAETWGVAEVKTEKGNRELYVPQAVLDAVKQREYIVKRNKLKYGAEYKNLDLICCHPDGNLISPQTVYHRFKRVLKGTDLPDIRFHDLRHSCASALLDMDVPLKVISDMLGHSSIDITADLYIDVLEKKKQPADIMQNKFFSKPGTEVIQNQEFNPAY